MSVLPKALRYYRGLTVRLGYGLPQARKLFPRPFSMTTVAYRWVFENHQSLHRPQVLWLLFLAIGAGMANHAFRR